MKQNAGFIAIHRKLLDWEWYSDINTTRLFLHLLLTANWEDKKWRGITIKRGQIVTSLPHLAQSTRLSIKSVRTALKNLKTTGEVADKTTNRFRLITVTKYEDYQDVFNKRADKTAGKRAGKGQQLNKYNKIINNIYMSYKEKINPSARLTSSAKQKIKLRLKSFSKLELKTAIRNFSDSDWWMENNASRGVAWFFNSDDRIDQFLNLKKQSKLIKF